MITVVVVAVAKLAPWPHQQIKMLNQLSNETISKIVPNLLHVDLKRFFLVSYRIRAITVPFLFRSLVFICPEGYNGQKIPSPQWS